MTLPGVRDSAAKTGGKREGRAAQPEMKDCLMAFEWLAIDEKWRALPYFASSSIIRLPGTVISESRHLSAGGACLDLHSTDAEKNCTDAQVLGGIVMKSLIKAVAVAAVLVAPVVSFAQSQPANGPVTRAQVRNELVQLEKAGYRPSVNDRYYPQDIQAAEARVSAQNGVQTSGYGSATDGSSQSGGPRDGAVSSYSPPVYNAH